jgi:hypothetical protein
VIYCIHRFKLAGKILNMIILAVATVAIFFVSARASFLSLGSGGYSLYYFCIIDHRKEKKLEKHCSASGSFLFR